MIFQFSKPKRTQKTKTKQVQLTKHDVKPVPAYFSYVDLNGEEHEYTGEYKKQGNTYSFTKYVTIKHPVDCLVDVTTETINSHFTYMDKDGYNRVFNKMDSLEYSEGSYFGDIEVVDYVDEKIEIFKEDK